MEIPTYVQWWQVYWTEEHLQNLEPPWDGSPPLPWKRAWPVVRAREPALHRRLEGKHEGRG